MRYAYLDSYLSAVLPPIQVRTLIDACEVLHRAGVDGHDFALEQELSLAEDGDTALAVQSIRNVILPLMATVLSHFGLTLNPDTSLAEMVDILTGLLDLENYGDPVTVVQMCDNAEGPEESLSQILPLVGAYSTGHYLPLLEEVSGTLIERIEQIMTKQMVPELVDDTLRQQCRERLLSLQSKLVNEDIELLVIKDIRLGSKLGLPLQDYFRNDLHNLHDLAPAALAPQILGYVLASNTPNEKLREACDNEFDALYSDPAKVTQADVALVKLLSE